MVMRAEVFNYLLDNKLLDDDENQRPQSPYIYISFSSVSSSNLCLTDHSYSVENLYLADNPYLANNPCFIQLNQTHFSSLLFLAKAKLSSLELQYENNAYYIFLYMLANSLLATRGSEQKKLLNSKPERLI